MKITPLLSTLTATALLVGCSSTPGQTNNYSDTNAPATYTSTNNSATNVDNTKINARDQGGNSLTPLDQGNSRADINLSASIRKMVVSSTNNFSMTAQNIKIITKDGKVTLRGPVQTETEKTQIDAIAKGAAGDGNVENDLEVKSNQ